MVLYLLVFSLFYEVDNLKYKYSNFLKYENENEKQMKNLVDDVNYNDKFLKKYLDNITTSESQ
tara:strand:- start:439 stop:627 length:189 start_codon:yes stop_codon:yes gene_type:complete